MRPLALFCVLGICINTSLAQNVGINNTTPEASLDIKGDVIFRVDTLVLVNGVNDNIDIGTSRSVNYVITGPNTTFELGGFSDGRDGRTITLYNSSPAAYYVKSYSVGTAAINQINTGTGSDFAMNSYSTITFQYLAADSLWHVVSRYNEIGGLTGGQWTSSGNHIYNNNIDNVGINTTEPLSRLSVNGELALLSDTIIVPCAISMNQLKIIDNANKRKSIIHLVEDDNCGSLPPYIMTIKGGNDGEIIHLFTHINNTNIIHLGNPNNTFPPMPPSPQDSMEMIELYEPNTSGNNSTAIQLKAGAVISLIYDGKRKKWKPVSYYGEEKPDYGVWYKGSNPTYMYAGSSRVGIGTGSPTHELDIAGDLRVRDSVLVDGNVSIQDNVNVNGNIGVDISNSPYPIHINRGGVGFYQSWQGNPLYTYLESTNAGIASGYGSSLEISNSNAFIKFVGPNVGISNNSGFTPNASLAVERGSGIDGTAAFFGTSNVSHFNYSTAEDTYLRGGKVSSKLILNDYGGQVTVGTSNAGNAQLNIASHRTGANANGLSITQNTTNSGNDSYGLAINTNGGHSNRGVRIDIGGSGLYQNIAGEFYSNATSPAGSENRGIYAEAKNSPHINIGGEFIASGNNAAIIFGVSGKAYNTSSTGISAGVYGFGQGCPAGKFDGYVEMSNNLSVNYDVYCDELFESSDETLKRNITTISSSIQNILKVVPVNYYWKKNKSELQTGVIAQELQKVYPELVTTDKDGKLAVRYTGLIPHLVKAIQEQQEMIEQLKSDNQILIAELKNEIKELKKNIKN